MGCEIVLWLLNSDQCKTWDFTSEQTLSAAIDNNIQIIRSNLVKLKRSFR
jgi:hypothetical protein